MEMDTDRLRKLQQHLLQNNQDVNTNELDQGDHNEEEEDDDDEYEPVGRPDF